MPRPLAIVLLSVVLLSRAALGDYQSGVRAWGHGDYAAAAAAFQSAAEAGEPESQYMMGRLYSLGDGVPRDFVQAWLWFDRAARKGHAEAAQARTALEGVLNPRQLAMARQLAAPPAPPVSPSPDTAQAPAAAQVAQAPVARPLMLLPRRGAVEMAPADQQQAAR
ncbi:MAG: SEL1-like repeat protein [Bacteroidales bacterium]